MPSSLKQFRDLLLDYLRAQWARVLLLAPLLFTGIGLQLINPQIVRFFIDQAQAAPPLTPSSARRGSFWP